MILTSEDTHYSIPKASNLLQIDWLKIPVGFENREIDTVALDQIIKKSNSKRKKIFLLPFQTWEQLCLVLLITRMIILLF